MELNNFINDLLENDAELKTEYDNLGLKYDLINKLIKFRKENDLTQKDFAKMVGLKQQAISRFEKGEIDPRLSFIKKIINGMNLKVIFENNDYSQNSILSTINNPIIN